MHLNDLIRLHATGKRRGILALDNGVPGERIELHPTSDPNRMVEVTTYANAPGRPLRQEFALSTIRRRAAAGGWILADTAASLAIRDQQRSVKLECEATGQRITVQTTDNDGRRYVVRRLPDGGRVAQPMDLDAVMDEARRDGWQTCRRAPAPVAERQPKAPSSRVAARQPTALQLDPARAAAELARQEDRAGALDVAQLVAEVRRQLGGARALPQRTLAAMLGVTRFTVCRWESDSSDSAPSPWHAEALRLLLAATPHIPERRRRALRTLADTEPIRALAAYIAAVPGELTT